MRDSSRPGSARREMPSVPETGWLRLLPPATRFVFHGDARARLAAAASWGVPFSEEACRAATAGARSVLWLGPDEYLLLAADSAAERTAVLAIEEAVKKTPHALVDVGHRQVALELRGPHAALILNSSCPLDLDLGAFPVGMSTRTVLAKADIVLWRTGAEVFHLEVWRSFTQYVAALLGEVAREFTGAC